MAEGKDFKKIVAEVKMAYDIVDYVQQSGITLKQRGNKNVGLCPFHTEKTPSFNVDSHFQNFRCFGCGEHGDLLSFVEKYERLDFMEAVLKLAEDKNIAVEIDTENNVDYKSLRACIKAVANFFVKEFRALSNDHPAKKEITERGLSVKGFLYGYAPEGRDTLYKFLKGKGFSDDTIMMTGVCRKNAETGSVWDFWQGRLMFFITDISGRPIGFSGRKLYETDKAGKYVNSSDTPLFDKSNALFNIEKAKKDASDNQVLYVNEGQFDVVALVESGLNNVVASSGTAFTTNQALMCRRLVSDSGKIVFCFDGDKAGREAAMKVFKNTPAIHAQSYVVSFPEGMDPCDYKMKYGADELRNLVENSRVPLVEFVMTNIGEKYDMTSALERSNYIEEVAKVLTTISNVPLRESYIRRIALDSFTPVEAVREVVSKAQSSVSSVERRKKDSSENENKTSEVKEVELRDYEKVDEPEGEEDSVDEADFIPYENMVGFINDDETYNAVAKLLNLTFTERRFLPVLVKNKKIIPEPFWNIIDDMEKNEEKEKWIPELFERSDVVRYILDANLLPFSHLMDTERQKKHYKFLLGYLHKVSVSERKNYVRTSISKALQKSENLDSPVDLFEKALAKEKKMLSSTE